MSRRGECMLTRGVWDKGWSERHLALSSGAHSGVDTPGVSLGTRTFCAVDRETDNVEDVRLWARQ